MPWFTGLKVYKPTLLHTSLNFTILMVYRFTGIQVYRCHMFHLTYNEVGLQDCLEYLYWFTGLQAITTLSWHAVCKPE